MDLTLHHLRVVEQAKVIDDHVVVQRHHTGLIINLDLSDMAAVGEG